MRQEIARFCPDFEDFARRQGINSDSSGGRRKANVSSDLASVCVTERKNIRDFAAILSFQIGTASPCVARFRTRFLYFDPVGRAKRDTPLLCPIELWQIVEAASASSFSYLRHQKNIGCIQ
ncbi:MAG TPA: hypothetical protein VFU50_03110 [Terriglobales bacterium]|nr:hypothetical protein [Terriglobales bacterium]